MLQYSTTKNGKRRLVSDHNSWRVSSSPRQRVCRWLFVGLKGRRIWRSFGRWTWKRCLGRDIGTAGSRRRKLWRRERVDARRSDVDPTRRLSESPPAPVSWVCCRVRRPLRLRIHRAAESLVCSLNDSKTVQV